MLAVSELSRPTLYVYLLPWHLERSAAFEELLLRPVGGSFDCRLVAWDGTGFPPGLDAAINSGTRHFTFCQVRPPDLTARGVRVTWLPMWDQYRREPDRFWDAVPDDVAILSFSDETSQRAKAAGREHLDVRYFPDPDELPRVVGEKKIFYWNRVGLVGPRLLARIAARLGADELVFRDLMDPHALPSARYVPDAREIGCRVTVSEGILDRSAYLELVRSCTVFVAPRECEGVGLSYLEAMGMGAAVIGLDAPTMNENIEHGIDGWLMKPRSLRQRLREAAGVRAGLSAGPFLADNRQSLEWLDRTNPVEIGKNARSAVRLGRGRWQEDWPAIARFIRGAVG